MVGLPPSDAGDPLPHWFELAIGTILFSREVRNAIEAIQSAIDDSEDSGLSVTGVVEDLITIDDIAEKTGRTAPAVGHWTTGERGPCAFPAPGRPTRAATVFSQAGEFNSGFVLRYAPGEAGGHGGYQIEMPDKDEPGAVRQTAEHPAFQSQLDWDHVAIVYDASAGQMRLYVNGQLSQSVNGQVSWRDGTNGFDATGAFQIGRSKSDGVWGEYWPGVIDDV